MNKVNEASIGWEEQFSPKRTFGVLRKSLSLAAGGKKDIGLRGGGHPFDVERVCVPPGMTNWPFHRHAAQWEMYMILAGRGKVRTSEETLGIRAGDFIVHPPGEAHRIVNDSGEDLVYYVIADNPEADVIHYPDTGKYFVKPYRKCFGPAEVPYFEEDD